MKMCLHARRANLANLEYQHKYMWNQASDTQNNVDSFVNFLENHEDKLKELSEEIENGENDHANGLLLELYEEKKEHKESLEESIYEREAQIKDVEYHYKEIEVKIEKEKEEIKELETDIKRFKKHHDFTEDFDFAVSMAQDEW